MDLFFDVSQSPSSLQSCPRCSWLSGKSLKHSLPIIPACFYHLHCLLLAIENHWDTTYASVAVLSKIIIRAESWKYSAVPKVIDYDASQYSLRKLSTNQMARVGVYVARFVDSQKRTKSLNVCTVESEMVNSSVRVAELMKHIKVRNYTFMMLLSRL
jgi:hypothetical protein